MPTAAARTDIVERRFVAEPATPEAIAPYGCLLAAQEDGQPFGPADARLRLDGGTPRFYVMRLHRRPMAVRQITRHLRVTQCLASLEGRRWFILMAPPDPADPAGAAQALPDPARLRAFAIDGSQALALHRGTWHAGPFFLEDEVSFVNLELSDTNLTDHDSVRLDQAFGMVAVLQPVEAEGGTL